MGKSFFFIKNAPSPKKTPKIGFFDIFPEVSVKTLLRAGKDLNYGSFSFLTLGVKLGRIEKKNRFCVIFLVFFTVYKKPPYAPFPLEYSTGGQNILRSRKNFPEKYRLSPF